MNGQLIKGKTYESVFCPNCGAFIVLSDGEYPNEAFCPSENQMVALPSSVSRGKFTVTKIDGHNVTIDADA